MNKITKENIADEMFKILNNVEPEKYDRSKGWKNKMEVLIKENEMVYFLIEFTNDDFESYADFNVYEVTSWNIESETPLDNELYIRGMIKWDGCSHINFGDSDGYIHLCGKRYFEMHKKVMDAVWKMCSEKIKMFDEEVAS